LDFPERDFGLLGPLPRNPGIIIFLKSCGNSQNPEAYAVYLDNRGQGAGEQGERGFEAFPEKTAKCNFNVEQLIDQ